LRLLVLQACGRLSMTASRALVRFRVTRPVATQVTERRPLSSATARTGASWGPSARERAAQMMRSMVDAGTDCVWAAMWTSVSKAWKDRRAVVMPTHGVTSHPLGAARG
jgi:hypothetical protein